MNLIDIFLIKNFVIIGVDIKIKEIKKNKKLNINKYNKNKEDIINNKSINDNNIDNQNKSNILNEENIAINLIKCDYYGLNEIPYNYALNKIDKKKGNFNFT